MLKQSILDRIEQAISNEMGLKEIADMFGVKYASGANMDCLLFPDVAVKWVREVAWFHVDSGHEAEFVRGVALEDRKHFPKTEKIGRLTLQERVKPLNEFLNIREEFDREMYLIPIIQMAFRYGVSDLHGANIGVRSDSDKTPIIFDLTSRENHAALYRADVKHRINDGEREEEAHERAFIYAVEMMNFDWYNWVGSPSEDYHIRRKHWHDFLLTIRTSIMI